MSPFAGQHDKFPRGTHCYFIMPTSNSHQNPAKKEISLNSSLAHPSFKSCPGGKQKEFIFFSSQHLDETKGTLHLKPFGELGAEGPSHAETSFRLQPKHSSLTGRSRHSCYTQGKEKGSLADDAEKKTRNFVKRQKWTQKRRVNFYMSIY